MTLFFDPIANAPGNLCRFNATSNGTGNFVVASAYDASHVTPSQADAIDGHVYTYFAQSADGTQWEKGTGAWTLSTTTIARTSVIANSLGTTDLVNFATVPIVDLFPAAPKLELGFPSGTLMLFQQSSAPVGWTKQTTHNDKALRVVSGAASSGGANAFSTVMAQTVVGSHTLSSGEMPSHTHDIPVFLGSGGANTGIQEVVDGLGAAIVPTVATGGSGSHNHAITMNILYVDLIIAQKN